MKLFLITTLCFFSLFFTPTAKACGFDGEYEYPDFFHKSFLSDPAYIRYASPSHSCDDCNHLLREAIVKEWQSEFSECDLKSIETAIFGLDESVIKSLRDHTNPFPNNKFFSVLLSNNRTDIIDYLEFIVHENSMTAENDEYNWEYVDKDIDYAKELLATAQQRYNDVNTTFLKQRYFFQIIKLLFYTEQYAELIKYYKENQQKGFPLTLTYYRTLGYYAGAIRKNDNPIEAKYLFAKIFDNAPALRDMSYKNFKYIDLSNDKQWQSLLSLAKSESERSAIWIAQNIYEDVIDIQALKQLYAHDPTSPRLELAIIKQMNHFFNNYLTALRASKELDEDLLYPNAVLFPESNIYSVYYEESNINQRKNFFLRIWESIVNFFKRLFGKANNKDVKMGETTDLSGEPEAIYTPFVFPKQWSEELKDLLEQINKEQKVKNKELFSLALAFTYVANGNYPESQSLLESLLKSKDKKMADLAEYIFYWTELIKDENFTEESENKIIAYYNKNKKWLDESKVNKNEVPNETFINWSNDLRKELGRRYLVDKKYDKALIVLEMYFVEPYYTSEIFSNLLNKNKIDEDFTSCFGKLDYNEIKTVYARKLALAGEFEKAASVQDDYLQSSTEDLETKYSTLAALKKEGGYENYKRIAQHLSFSETWDYNQTPCYNYFYNENTSSYPFNIHGIAETMDNRIKAYNRMKYSTELAEIYFRKAFNETSDEEEKAELLLLAVEVAMKDKYVLQDRYSEDAASKNYYYQELNEYFANTKTYKEAYNSCSFLRSGQITYY